MPDDNSHTTRIPRFTPAIAKRISKKRCCLKCDTTENITRHHIIPKAHTTREDPGETAPLCRSCHNAFEIYILSVESFAGKVSFGTRFKLPDPVDYYEALILFLGSKRSAGLLWAKYKKSRPAKRKKSRRDNRQRGGKVIRLTNPAQHHQQRRVG